jgi:starvation-inducible DNA-binding protein
MMTITEEMLTAERPRTAELLQATLVELIDLAIQGKQAHWTVTGPLFKPLHEHLDALVDDARGWYDDVAERLAAIEVAPDGRLETVAAAAPLEPMPAGWQVDAEVVRRFVARLDEVADRFHARIEELAELDPISQDLLIGIGHSIEKHRWMLRVQVSGR